MKKFIIPALLFLSFTFACNNSSQMNSEQMRQDSIRIADSISLVHKQQRAIDSLNTVQHEQQIIADSIEALLNN